MSTSATPVVQRRLFEIVQERLSTEVVIGLQGPRSVGKSTLMRTVASEAGVGVIDLDDPAIREAVASDPAIFVRGPSPVCIDEYQHAPIVLDAIKAELNREQRPGRFLSLVRPATRRSRLPHRP